MKPALILLVLMVSSCTAPAHNSASVHSQPVVAALTLPPTTLTSEQQTTHVLNRLAFGPSPEDRERIRSLGLEGWLRQQVSPGKDEILEGRLSDFTTLTLSVPEVFAKFPDPKQQLKESGVELSAMRPEDLKAMVRDFKKANRDQLPIQILIEASQAKLIRAIVSKRQFEEVMVDFWFNHFNVSAEKNKVRWLVTAYERDAIRPFVFGKFSDMLMATAKHPAMLVYLDNWLSVRDGFELPRGKKGPATGLNENYARELLELHTLGVEAGYSQHDVREAARALTGWTVQLQKLSAEYGTFMFRPRAHDAGDKTVFGLELPQGRGIEDGEALLAYLSRHPATAHHLSLKLCQRLVSDAPPDELVNRVAEVFLKTDGDLPSVYRAIVESPEFWAATNENSKTKTPLEFVTSAIRATGTLNNVDQPLGRTLELMGQPLYRSNPPTGFAEVSAPWISAGALVTRINFGLRLSKNQISGVAVSWPATKPTIDESITDMSQQILGQSPSEKTRTAIRRALGDQNDDGIIDGERRSIDMALIAGLLLGSPEFQKQ